MWTEDILKAVFDLSSSDSSFSSFTSVGKIRRALQENGFDVSKVSGFGTKRHRIIGKKFIETKKSNGIKKVAIIGAGLSGSNLAFNLANSNIEVEVHNIRLERDNVLELFEQYDIIADGSDNFETRYLINDSAYFTKKPLVSASIFRFEGQITIFDPESGGPCYRCLFSEPPPPALVPS